MSAPIALSFQSRVAYGHVGNSSACFVLQRLGCEVVDIPTVLLSAHPGHGRPGGGPVPATQLTEIVDGLERIGVLDRVQGIVVGYLGTDEAGLVAERLVQRVKAGNPAVFTVIDPVIGDRDGGCYVRDGVGDVFRDRLLPLADLATPNHFELEWLAGGPITSFDGALAALDRLGVGDAVVTSFEGTGYEGAGGSVGEGATFGTLARLNGRLVHVPAEKYERLPSGLGDTLAATLLAHLLAGASRPVALARAVAATEALIAASVAAGLDELPLVARQDLLVDTSPVRLHDIEG